MKDHLMIKSLSCAAILPLAAAIFLLCSSPAMGNPRPVSPQASDGQAGAVPELVVQLGHSAEVSSVAFSHDGRLMASGSRDNTVKIWDGLTWTLMKTIDIRSFDVNSISFSPDEKFMATMSYDFIKIWDRKNWACVKTLSDAPATFSCCAYSPDGTHFTAGNHKKCLKIWDTRTWNIVRTFPQSSAPVYSADGKFMACVRSDKDVVIMDRRTWKTVATLRGHRDAIMSLHYSPDGRCLLSQSYDRTIKVWDTRKGLCAATLTGFSGFDPCSFSPDSSIFAIVHSSSPLETEYGQPIRFYDTRTWKCTRILKGPGGGYGALAFSPDGTRIVAGCNDSTLWIWNTCTWALVKSIKGRSGSVEYVRQSPSGAFLVVGRQNEEARVWSTTDGLCIKTLKGKSASFPNPFSFSADGKYALHTIHCEELRDDEFHNTVMLYDAETWEPARSCIGDYAVFSADGSHAAFLIRDYTIRIMNRASWKPVMTIKGSEEHQCVSFSYTPDGKHIIAGTNGDTVDIWELESGRCIRTLKGYEWQRQSGLAMTERLQWDTPGLPFSPDGKWLVLFRGKSIEMWDTAAWECRKTIAQDGETYLVAFSHDGRVIASLDRKGTVRLWDKETGALKGTFSTGSGESNIFTFSPDGSRIITEDYSTIRQWRLP